jgi:hypothetical protein
MGHQELSTCIAFFALDTRTIIKPRFASGGVAQ